MTPSRPRRGSPRRRPTTRRGERGGLSFQTRLTLVVIAAAIIPLGSSGLLLIARRVVDAAVGSRLLLFVVAITVVLAMRASGLRRARPDPPAARHRGRGPRVVGGRPHPAHPGRGNDVLAQLAESHNRLAADVDRRNRQLGRILAAVEAAEPRDGLEPLADRAARDAETAFGFISAVLQLVDPATVPAGGAHPRRSRCPIRAELSAGDERIGVLTGSLQATRSWERADQNLLELYASQIGAALRNAAAVRPGRGAERPVAESQRGQGRLPARRQPQPPDAADRDPLECRRRCRRRRRPAIRRLGDHLRTG